MELHFAKRFEANIIASKALDFGRSDTQWPLTHNRKIINLDVGNEREVKLGE